MLVSMSDVSDISHAFSLVTSLIDSRGGLNIQHDTILGPKHKSQTSVMLRSLQSRGRLNEV